MLTIATKETSAFKKFMRSASDNKLPVKVLGMGQKWKGFLQKIDLLKQELENHKNNSHLIILFADGSDSLFSSGTEEILRKFRQFNAKVVYSAEENCIPDQSLSSKWVKSILKLDRLQKFKICKQLDIRQWH